MNFHETEFCGHEIDTGQIADEGNIENIGGSYVYSMVHEIGPSTVFTANQLREIADKIDELNGEQK